MTLDDAIAHAREVAAGCGECAEEHAQLADWLDELRALKALKEDGETMSISKDDWELVLEDMSECPKCGGKAGVYTRALIGETTTRVFGCSDVNDCEHSIIRGGTVFYCIDCDRPLFDSDGKTR